MSDGHNAADVPGSTAGSAGPQGHAPQSRYVIGIDLGTTNSALAYVDTQAKEARPQVLPLLQWEGDGAVVQSEMLPSFYALPVKAEWRKGQLKLPGLHADEAPDFAVGRWARQKATTMPGRVVHSAKSWLAHASVGREERILPWHSDEVIGDERRSPVEVAAAYLAHLKAAWDAEVAGGRREALFDHQDITITVPASFDEVAQRLTLQAAQLAGYPAARLLEEPQAAFYYWLAQHGPTALQGLLAETPATGAYAVLICDIGGGTSDFSLFSVRPADVGQPEIERIAVSDHLLLGGDNIDLSLALLLEQKLVGAGRRLSSRQWAQLVFEVRKIKERALAGGPAAVADDESLHVAIAGEGSSLMASAMTASLTVAEIKQQVLSGFLPDCGPADQPQAAKTGLRQLGLPYAHDTAISRHLAGFLSGRHVDAVLFTGGTLRPEFMRDRITALLTGWQGRAPVVLENTAMDLAVALGAASYGTVLRQPTGAIKGGYPRSLYVEVARPGGDHALVCIVPQGFASHVPVTISSLALKAVANRPVRFQLFSSNRRPQDTPGTVVTLASDTFHPLPALHTRLDMAEGGKGERLLDVGLEILLQDTGILLVNCVHQEAGGAEPKRWRLDFNVRLAAADLEGQQAQPVSTQPLPAAKLQAVQHKLESVYGKKKRPDGDGDNPKYLVRDLEQLLGLPREAWDTAFLRSLWPLLEPGLTRRGRSVGHELSWLYLAGYALRPGYGYELDEWRVAELWRAYELGMAFPKERQIEEQWWILWRRVAGGLTRDQQEVLFDKIFPALRKGEASSPEIYMLAGSLERVDMGKKVRLGTQIVKEIVAGRKQFLDQKMWLLARLASRVPLYAGPDAIIRPKFVSEWFAELRPLDLSKPPYQRLNLFLMQAGRIVEDREFDLPADVRRDVLQKMRTSGATEEQLAAVKSYVPVDMKARVQLFGESLPAGLLLG